MGFWHQLKNINNAEGTRETMRMSYDKHFKLAMEGKIPLNGETPHRVALYGALGSRFRVRWLFRGIPVDKVIEAGLVWTDLLPFLFLDQQTAREALAEYVVYKEMPKDAKISWLETVVQRGCELLKSKKDKEEYDAFMSVAKINDVVWLLLLEGRGNEYFWG